MKVTKTTGFTQISLETKKLKTIWNTEYKKTMNLSQNSSGYQQCVKRQSCYCTRVKIQTYKNAKVQDTRSVRAQEDNLAPGRVWSWGG